MKKILIFSNSLSSLYIFRSHLINHLANKDLEIKLLSNYEYIDEVLKKKIILKSNINFHYIKLDRTSIKIIGEIKTFFSILFFIIKYRPTHVYSFTIKPVIYTGLINLFLKFDHIPTITGLGRIFYPIWKRTNLKLFILFLYKITLTRVKKILFQNHDDQEYFIDSKLVSKNKTLVVNGSGVDINYFNFDQNGFNNNKFLMIGRLLNQKGIKIFIETAKLIKEKYNGFEFILIGKKEEGPDSIHLSEIEHFIKSGIIKYIESTNDVRKYLKNCKIFVLPSYYREGMPKTMIEAMSIGRPVVVSDIPGPKEIIKNKKHGILLDLKDEKSLFKAIEYFIKINKKKYNEISENCRKTAVDIFDVKKINKIYENFL